MSTVRPFPGLRPQPEEAARVSSPPYDVLSVEEAREMAAQNEHSFLRVIRAELEFDEGSNPYSDEVYQRSGENLKKLQTSGVMFQDKKACFYLYQQQMGAHRQTGLVATASCEEYEQDRIRKHEHTRPEKENDRARHIELVGAQTGPVFLTYRAAPAIDELVEQKIGTPPEAEFTAPDGIIHRYWVIEEPEQVEAFRALFQEKVPALYVADGHHRSAAATRLSRKYREKPDVPADAPYHYFLSVIFPHDQMKILAYNRVVHDLRGLSAEVFLQRLKGASFSVRELQEGEEPPPPQPRQFGMYLQKKWYRIEIDSKEIDAADPVASLDVSLLQNKLLHPLLGIEDPRTDKRIDFVGGIRGAQELEKRVDGQGDGVAFYCYPTSIDQLLRVADAGKVMPPKSTWFEPKLRSGLFVHLLDR